MSSSQPSPESSPANSSATGPAPTDDGQLRGRSVFMVETVAAGVAVRPAFLAEDGRLLDLPAVFPDMGYAMAQIDELRRLVSAHFSQAAQIGAQVIAAQAAAGGAGGSATAPVEAVAAPAEGA
jgi:hypothetical protein